MIYPSSRTRKTTVYLRGIDRATKDFFKAWCAKRGLSMTKKIEQLMRETVKQDLKDQKREQREGTT